MNYILILIGWILHLLFKIGKSKTQYKSDFNISKWTINNWIYIISSLLCVIAIILMSDLSDNFDKKIKAAGIEFYYTRVVCLMIGLCSTSIIDLFIKIFKLIKLK